nr:MAG TPA: hypothetical protein [Caudoviricetes sp.]
MSAYHGSLLFIVYTQGCHSYCQSYNFLNK